jgi:hypothetical protein
MSAAGWDGDKLPCCCGLCLRVVRLTKDQMLEVQDDNGEIICADCGGDVCWCGYCQHIARGLLSGVRDRDALGLQGAGDISWNERGGVRE